MLFGQDAASLWITVADPSDALVPGAHLTLTDIQRGTVRQADSNSVGAAVFDPLPPGEYTLEVAKPGFDRVRAEKITLAVRDRQTLRLALAISTVKSSSVTVSEAQAISTDANIGVPLSREYLENLPINGRNAESLVLMAPGITSGSGGRGGVEGGFNANGLRSNTNYFTLDGTSTNSDVGGGGGGGGPARGGRGFGGGPGGGELSFGSGGATEMISIDSMQEIRVQTSSFSPEFGRSPGAQVAMTSRGGSNAFHGSVFYYWRSDRLNANDWFANSTGYPRNHMSQNRPGATLGGPIFKNRTFFFASFEELRLLTPVTILVSVPDVLTRRSAPRTMRPYLNAFPVPNGPELGDGAAQFRALITNPSKSYTGSFRLDQKLSQTSTLFLRYSLSPSNSESRASEMFSPNIMTQRDSRTHTVTGGWTKTLSGSALNDLRVSYTKLNGKGTSVMDDFGGATPLTDSAVFPKGVTSLNGDFTFNISGLSGYSYASRQKNQQQQINAVDSISKITGSHSFKAGVDYRRIMPTTYRTPYSQSAIFNGLSSDDGGAGSGIAINAMVSSSLDAVYPLYVNYSAYGQDNWRATDRTTLTYGLRWDVNPAPGVRSGPKPLAKSDSSVAGVTQNEPLYATNWYNVAPRIGLAYQMDTTEGKELILRAGGGLFYDSGSGITSGAFSGAPYSNDRTITLATFPLSATDAAPPTLPPGRPYGSVTTADTNLKSPMVIQWNVALERHFGSAQMLSLGYVGTRGRNLLRVDTQPAFSTAYSILRLATNGAQSKYNGLQAQFRRRMSGNLQVQASYTYAHSIDSASSDAGFGGGFATLYGAAELANSDYDIRHNLNFSGTYRLPGPGKGLAGLVIGGWYTDWVVTWRTGLPFDVQGISSAVSSTSSTTTSTTNNRSGLFAQVRPDYNGLPVWISDSTVPSGKRVNAKAFTAPSGYNQGNLARNALRGLGASQADVAIRKQFPIHEKIKLNLSAQAFNVLNHPNFANPSAFEGANLSSPNFGILTRMLNQSFGGGVNGVYRSGGPRSMEIALRLQF